VCFGVIGPDPNRFPKLRDRFVGLVRLRQHQAGIVVRLGVIRTQAIRLAKFGQHLVGIRTFAPQQQSDHVVDVGALRVFRGQPAKARDGSVPVGSRRQVGRIHSRFQLSQGFVEFALAEKNDSQVNVVRCCRWQ
jgi:hypothetical protein